MSDNTTMKLIVRYLDKRNQDNPSAGTFSIESVNTFVSEWLNKGYKLIDTHYLGTQNLADGVVGFGMLFVLAKDVVLSAKKAKEVSLED